MKLWAISHCCFSSCSPRSPLSYWKFSSYVQKSWTYSSLQSGHCVHGAARRPVSPAPGGFDWRLLQMPAPLFLFCEPVCFQQEERKPQPPPWAWVSAQTVCQGCGSQGSRGASESHGPPWKLTQPHSQYGASLCPSIWRLWFPLGRERLPFFSWRDTRLTGQVGEMHLDVCSLFMFLSSFSLHSSFPPCWMVPFLEFLWGLKDGLVWFSSRFSSTCVSSSLLT